MYFWNINGLRTELKQKTMSERDKAFYLFFFILPVLLEPLVSGLEINEWDLYVNLFIGTSSLIGLTYCYRLNGGLRGTQFLERFLSLGWVITVRLAIMIFIPLTIVSFVLMEIVGFNWKETGWPDLVFIFFATLALFAKLGAEIRRLALEG